MRGLEALDRLFDYLDNAYNILSLSILAVAASQRIAELHMEDLGLVAEDLAGLDELTGDEKVKQLRKSLEMAKYGRIEAENGFPFLHAHATVGLWGALEAFVEDIVVSFLIARPDLRNMTRLEKVRVPLLVFEEMDTEDRYRHLLWEYIRDTGTDRASGLTYLDGMFSAVNMTGEVDPTTACDLFELHQVRNLIVHRGSIVDRKFAKDCGWMDVRVGQRLTVGLIEYRRYWKSVHQYLRYIIDVRCVAVIPPEKRQKLLDEMAQNKHPENAYAETAED